MPATNSSREKSKIRKLDVQWGKAASAPASPHRTEDVVAFYAPKGTLVWPGAPPHHGTAAIRAAWDEAFAQFDGLKLKFTAERVDFSKSGDMASDFGRVDFGYNDPEKGRVEMKAKYVVVWIKIKGQWKVLYDSWNANS
jgi:ketosteroid isomerase-like protein